MFETEFAEALSGARTLAHVDSINLDFLRLVSAGAVQDEEAERIDAAIAKARQRVKNAAVARASSIRSSSPPRARREKLFGLGRPRPLDREGKVRLMHRARALSRRTEKGKAYGAITAKALAVFQVLLWEFHNAKSGICFPSYERIAKAASCARSTVAKCIKALELAGLLTWVNRLVRVRKRWPGLDGLRVRILRTSNGYAFADPAAPANRPMSSKSEMPTGTLNQEVSSFRATAFSLGRLLHVKAEQRQEHGPFLAGKTWLS